MKKIELEDVSTDSTEYTGICFGDQLPKDVQLVFDIADDRAIRITGTYSISTLAGVVQVDVYDAIAFLGVKETKIDLLLYMDLATLEDVLLSNYEGYEIETYADGLEDA